jgi:hypothetical protein
MAHINIVQFSDILHKENNTRDLLKSESISLSAAFSSPVYKLESLTKKIKLSSNSNCWIAILLDPDELVSTENVFYLPTNKSEEFMIRENPVYIRASLQQP